MSKYNLSLFSLSMFILVSLNGCKGYIPDKILESDITPSSNDENGSNYDPYQMSIKTEMRVRDCAAKLNDIRGEIATVVRTKEGLTLTGSILGAAGATTVTILEIAEADARGVKITSASVALAGAVIALVVQAIGGQNEKIKNWQSRQEHFAQVIAYNSLPMHAKKIENNDDNTIEIYDANVWMSWHLNQCMTPGSRATPSMNQYGQPVSGRPKKIPTSSALQKDKVAETLPGLIKHQD